MAKILNFKNLQELQKLGFIPETREDYEACLYNENEDMQLDLETLWVTVYVNNKAFKCIALGEAIQNHYDLQVAKIIFGGN